MASKSNTKSKDLRGPSIYQGEKAGTIFYDAFCKTGYIILNDDAQKYDDYKTYTIIALIIAIAAGLYGKFNFLIVIALFLAILFIARVLFQKLCLDKCVTIDYKPERKEFFLKTWAGDMKMKNLILIVFLSIILLALCVYNYYYFEQDETLKVLYIVFGIGVVIFTVGVIIAIFLKKQEEKNLNN